MAEVKTPEYQGVSVEHPRIVEAIKTLATKKKPDGTRYSTSEIMRIVGMPYEVVSRHQREAEKEKKG